MFVLGVPICLFSMLFLLSRRLDVPGSAIQASGINQLQYHAWVVCDLLGIGFAFFLFVSFLAHLTNKKHRNSPKASKSRASDSHPSISVRRFTTKSWVLAITGLFLWELLSTLLEPGAESFRFVNTIIVGVTYIAVIGSFIFHPARLRISKTPGSRLTKTARFFYSPKTVKRVFEPIYADFMEEYTVALAAGHRWHARWVCVRYYWSFAKAMGLFGLVNLAKTIFVYWKKIA